MTLEKKLVRLRKKEGMSQADVSEKLNVSRQAVSRWEAGDSRPSTENLQALCKLYNVKLDDLLDESNEEVPIEMFSFQVSSLEKDQSLCRELIKSRGKTISLLLNEIPFIVTIDTCSFSKTSDDMYFRDFNIIVLNQFFVYSN